MALDDALLATRTEHIEVAAWLGGGRGAACDVLPWTRGEHHAATPGGTS